jgi:uncharacterized protein YjiS (DUF1127 family)
MEGITSITGPRREFHAGYAFIEVLAELALVAIALPLRWIKAAIDAQRAARLRGELHALNDHMLKDIGLQRGQISELFR